MEITSLLLQITHKHSDSSSREKFIKEYEEAKAAGDMALAFAKSVMTSRLTQSMLEDTMRLLRLLGIPYVQAPGEGEAQASFMAKRGDAWGVGSKDYDSLLFGAPRLVRFVTISGREFLPSKGRFRPLKPEIIEAHKMLSHYQISLREIFYHPQTTEDYHAEYGTLDEDGLDEFLCKERDFSPARVKMIIERMKTKDYIGQYRGNQYERDRAYHQGTVWAWLIGPYISAYARAYAGRKDTRKYIEGLFRTVL